MSSYISVYIVVEGQTEQIFVRDVLAPYLGSQNISMSAVLLGRRGHKGGDVSFSRAKRDICNFLKQRPDTIVTTLFDYYGVSGTWPGYISASQNTLTAQRKAERIESALLTNIAESLTQINVAHRFIPFFMMHEFEALLFSEPSVLADKLNIGIGDIQQIIAECGEPEEINNSPLTAPSKRIEALLGGAFRKTSQGVAIARLIGIPKMRSACPHFDNWLERIERKGREL